MGGCECVGVSVWVWVWVWACVWVDVDVGVRGWVRVYVGECVCTGARVCVTPRGVVWWRGVACRSSAHEPAYGGLGLLYGPRCLLQARRGYAGEYEYECYICLSHRAIPRPLSCVTHEDSIIHGKSSTATLISIPVNVGVGVFNLGTS